MSFLLGAALVAAFAIAGTYFGDPFYRQDRDPGRWQTTVQKEEPRD